MAEVMQESTHVASSKQRSTLFLSAMRHFAEAIKAKAWPLLYAHAFSDFNDYLDFFYMAECLLADEGYEGMYQLASFHPDYCFNDAPADDPANYTNRSPYPMVHILREHSLTKAIDQHPNAEEIPERNIALTRQLGLEAMQQLLDSCYQR